MPSLLAEAFALSKTTAPLMNTSARESLTINRHCRMPGLSGVTMVERNAAPRWFLMLYVPHERYFSGPRTRFQRVTSPRKLVSCPSAGASARMLERFVHDLVHRRTAHLRAFVFKIRQADDLARHVVVEWPQHDPGLDRIAHSDLFGQIFYWRHLFSPV